MKKAISVYPCRFNFWFSDSLDVREKTWLSLLENMGFNIQGIYQGFKENCSAGFQPSQVVYGMDLREEGEYSRMKIWFRAPLSQEIIQRITESNKEISFQMNNRDNSWLIGFDFYRDKDPSMKIYPVLWKESPYSHFRVLQRDIENLPHNNLIQKSRAVHYGINAKGEKSCHYHLKSLASTLAFKDREMDLFTGFFKDSPCRGFTLSFPESSSETQDYNIYFMTTLKY